MQNRESALELHPETRSVHQTEGLQEEEAPPASQYDLLARVCSPPAGAGPAEAHASVLIRATDSRPSRAGQSLLQLQRQYGNRYVQRVIDLTKGVKGKGAATSSMLYEMTLAPQERKTGSSPSDQRTIIQRQYMAYYTIRDPSLRAGGRAGGGEFVNSLREMRDHLVSNVHITPPPPCPCYDQDWTLVISIHGSQDSIVAPATRRHPRITYRASDIRRIFGTSQGPAPGPRAAAFQRWRQQHGPARVVLTACQVQTNLERTIIDSITRGTPRQHPMGLGPGCRPDTFARQVREGGVIIATRNQFNRLTRREKRNVLRSLRTLNSTWGYHGRQPVHAPPNPISSDPFAAPPQFSPFDLLLLRFYFDEVPRGFWPVVRVIVPLARAATCGRDMSSEPVHPRRRGFYVTNVPFYNRNQMQHRTRFRRCCPQSSAASQAAPVQHVTPPTTP